MLKSDASPELIDVFQNIEDQSDKWSDHLALATFPRDVAVWGVLTQTICLIEDAIEKHGFTSQKHRESMLNLSRSSTSLLTFLRDASLPDRPTLLRWTTDLAASTKDAILAAHNYCLFEAYFKLWHKNRVSGELLSNHAVRFGFSKDPMERRVRSYQQGARISGWPSTSDQPLGTSLVDDLEVKELLEKLWAKVTFEGALRYPDDSELLSALRDIYLVKTKPVFRRNPHLVLGEYTLEMFRKFYAALMAVCSVHEYLCFAWYKAHKRYPFESAVLVKTKPEWSNLLAALSDLPKKIVRGIIADLTLGATKPLEIYVHPFVPTADAKTLYLIPHFILNSRAEENILRVCSYTRPKLYSTIANAKEDEMRETIRKSLPPRYVVKGPIKLADATLPDIDILIEDRIGSAVLVGELKWLRKTIRVLEHVDRDVELENGFEQLKQLRQFFNHNPAHLSAENIISNPGCQSNISYALIARDHLVWLAPDEDRWLTEFDALIWALGFSANLDEAVQKLRIYKWLPAEGVDFYVRFEKAKVLDVEIEVEVFHRKSIPSLEG